MNRRGFIRTALTGAGAVMGAMLAGKVEADAPALKPGVRIGSAEYLALPPATMADPTPTLSVRDLSGSAQFTRIAALDTERAATLRRRAEDDAHHAAALVAVGRRQGTGLSINILTQSAPWTTEQMAKVRDEYRALPHVFRVREVEPGPREGEMYALHVTCEMGGLTSVVRPS
jgi:hypothetical protein